MRRARVRAVLAALHEAGLGLDALGEHLPDRVDAHGLRRLLGREAHVEEALAAQRVQQEPVLGDGEQHGHRVGQVGLDPQPEHDVLQLLSVDGVHRGVGLAEAVGEVLAGAGAAALADGEHVLAGQVGRRRGVERLRDERDAGALVGEREELVLDVGDADVARRQVVDRVRARGPHLGVRVGAEEPLLDVGGELGPLAALDRHDLHPTAVALDLRLPDDAVVLPGPAAFVDGDGDLRAHEVVEHQREGEADGAAAGDRHAQHGRRVEVAGRQHGGRVDGGRAGSGLEPEDLVADHDLVARPEPVGGRDPLPVDERAVAAAAVVQRPAARLRLQPRVHPGRQRGREHHVVAPAAAQRERLVAQGEALPCQLTADPDQPHRPRPLLDVGPGSCRAAKSVVAAVPRPLSSAWRGFRCDWSE